MKMNRFMAALAFPAFGILAAGCNDGSLAGVEFGSDDKKGPGGVNGDGTGVSPNGVDPNNPTATCGDRAQKWVGFGKASLLDDRVDAVEGVDRQRFKPYSALQGEYPRVTGAAAPGLLGQSGTTFGQAPARWNQEPEGSAVNLYTAFRIAFESCLTMTADDAKYAAAPAEPAAGAECSAMARKFWSRTPSPEDVAACVQVATVDSAKETNPRRRWAYTCASVLTSAGFLTY